MEKRQEKRLHKILRINMEQAGRKIFGSLMDVSFGGMKVRLLTRKHFLFNQSLIIQIITKTASYEIKASVRWQKEDLIDHSHIVGLQFSALNAGFCKDVLKIELGSKHAPYPCTYENNREFLLEYRNNIRYGGLKLKTESPPPPLYCDLYVDLYPPDRETPFPVLGEVVAHIPGGVGLRIKNHTQILKSLKPYD